MAGALVVIGVAAFLSLPRHSDGPRVLTDKTFVASANQRCKATLADLRPPFVGDSRKPTLEETAQSIDRVADQLHTLATQLQAIPVSPSDQPRLAGWFNDWNRYSDIGHQYATALRAQDNRTALDVSRTGDQVQRSADKFARANGISSCQFHAVPQGGGDPFSGGM